MSKSLEFFPLLPSEVVLCFCIWQRDSPLIFLSSFSSVTFHTAKNLQSMASDHATTSLTPTPPPPKNQSQDLPQVIVLKPPPVLNFFRDLFSKKFDLLVSWESPLPTDQFLTTHAHSVQAMLCSGTGPPISADIIRLLPSLKLVATTSAGLNHIDLTECRKRGIAIANAGEVFSEDVADMAVALLIDVLRKVSAADRYVRQRLWATKGDFPLGSKVFFSNFNSLFVFFDFLFQL
jgi:hypothetical protein